MTLTAEQLEKAVVMNQAIGDWLVRNPVEKSIGGNTVFYCRTAAGGSGAITEQLGELYLYSQAMGYENVCANYCDTNASGVSLNRPGLKKLLDDVRGGGVKTVITHDIARISRNIVHLYELMDKFAKHGVTLVTMNTGTFRPA
jgi:DNA invertase Pin-like site-specific DNA recombinase